MIYRHGKIKFIEKLDSSDCCNEPFNIATS